MKNETTGTSWITNLRVLATFSVIVLHVTAGILHKYGSATNFNWMVGNIYDSAVRFCVPVFLMLTGTLLLGKEIEINDFLKKRFSRILVPFIFWSCIYIVIKLKTRWQSGEDMSIISLAEYIFIQFRDGAALHLWYVYMVLGIYLFIPVLNKWVMSSTEKELLYFIFIWLFVLIINIPQLVFIKPVIDFSYFSGFIGYPVLGYYLSRFFNYKNTRGFALLFIIAGISVTITGTWLLTKRDSVFNESFYNYLSPNVLLASAGIFLFFKSFENRNNKLNPVINFIAAYSYGIYLSHILVLFYLSKIGIGPLFINPIAGILVTSILCLLASSGIVYLINKLPYGRYISG
jgi:surface polysaccharide O-acyltransferase-like enzyme